MSKHQIKRKVKELEDRAKPKDKGPAIGILNWHGNGKVECDGKTYDSEDEFETWANAQGYSQIFVLKWAVDQK